MTVSTIMGRQLPSQDPREQQLPGGNELLTRGRGQVTHPTHPSLTHPHTIAADRDGCWLADCWLGLFQVCLVGANNHINTKGHGIFEVLW